MNARKVVLEIMRRFDNREGRIEAIADRSFRRSNVDRRDRRFIYEAVHGILRHRIRLRYLASHFLADKQLAGNAALMRILEFGLYQIQYMDKVPNHAAVNESVNLTKADPRTSRYVRVVNAVLRAAIQARGLVPLPSSDNLSLRLAVEFSHPQWLVERWLSRYGLSNTRAALAFDNQIPTTFMRRKMRGISRQQFETDSRGILDRVGGYYNLYYRLSRKGMAPDELRLFELGACTVQAPSQGWVVAMLDVQRGDRCVDVCSAPGGKATLMAELAGDEGSVVACDQSFVRLGRVADNAARMNLRNMFPVACDGINPPFAGYFDKALIDVPCSGTGVLQRHPDARSQRTLEDIERVAEVQSALLESACNLVGPGGIIVYATCSLEPEENERQIAGLLERHNEFVLERPPRDIPRQYVDLDGYLRITPFEHGMDGAFAVRLRRR